MVGETIKINGIDFLVLDEFDDDTIFVIALNIDIQCCFNDKEDNNYRNSILRQKMEKWFKESGIEAKDRDVDLLTMDGYKKYDKLTTKVAPLTIDEYRKYADIIIPHINKSMWLATGWNRPSPKYYYDAGCVCFVSVSGSADYCGYYNGFYLAPALIINRNQINKVNLSHVSTKELFDELIKRYDLTL